jgi:hypothetical protein
LSRPSKSQPLSQSSLPQASSSSKLLALIISEVTGATRATTFAAAVAAGCVAHRLAVGHAAGDALAMAGVKLGLVVQLADLPPVVLRGMPCWHWQEGRFWFGGDKPMLAKRSFLESRFDFLGAVFWTGFLLPRLVILLIRLLFPPRVLLVKVACSVCPT